MTRAEQVRAINQILRQADKNEASAFIHENTPQVYADQQEKLAEELRRQQERADFWWNTTVWVVHAPGKLLHTVYGAISEGLEDASTWVMNQTGDSSNGLRIFAGRRQHRGLVVWV